MKYIDKVNTEWKKTKFGAVHRDYGWARIVKYPMETILVKFQSGIWSSEHGPAFLNSKTPTSLDYNLVGIEIYDNYYSSLYKLLRARL
jgi:hypothetical protein